MPVLIDRAIRYHSRRGIRWWCDCSFCLAKRQGTFRIGNYHKISPNATSYSNKYPWRDLPPIPRPYADGFVYYDFEWRRDGAWQLEDYYRRRVHEAREGERVKLRQELSDLVKEVL